MSGDTKCLCCGAEFVRADSDAWVTPEGIGLDVGVCPDCRRHAELGRLVEAMPEGCGVFLAFNGKWYADAPGSSMQSEGPTPIEALREAGVGR